MTITSRTRRLPWLLRRRSRTNTFYVDDTRGLLAIPVDSARVYRDLPLSSSR